MGMVTECKRFTENPLNIPRHLLRLGTLWKGAEDIVLSVFQNERTAVKAGHAMSKDWTAGFLILQWLLTYFGQSRVIVTGPTDRQVKEIVFAELAKQYTKFLNLYPAQGFRKDWLTTNKLDFGEDCFALGFTTKETEDMVGKFQGFHSANMLIIITEAQAVSSPTYKQLRGLITSKNSRILELGNPLIEFGDFYEHCTNPKYGYNVIHLPCTISPNVIASEEIIPGMATKEYISRMKNDCGPDPEDDAEYQGRVMAEFPQQSKNAWIPLSRIKAAVNRVFEEDANSDLIVAGLDTARSGDDETVFCTIRGRTQIQQDTFRKVLGPGTVGWAKSLMQQLRIRAFGIDIGYNPSILDWIGYEDMPTISINFGAESPDERFENLGTYMWYLAREAFINAEISIIDDPVLISQLSSRKVEMTPRGKRRLESKKVSRDHSPDRGDALVIAWYVRTMIATEMLMIKADNMNEASRMNGALNVFPDVRPTSSRRQESEETSSGGLEAECLRV